MSNRYRIEPNIILSAISDGFSGMSFIVANHSDILDMRHVNTVSTKHSYLIRKDIINTMIDLVTTYSVDTIVLEENKLFTDTFSKYPDPYILRSVLMDYGVKISIEDTFADRVKYILEIPEQEWKQKILNSKVRYSIDLYKTHVEFRHFTDDQLADIESNNYYKAICFSECCLYSSLMHTKYLINSGKDAK